MTPFQEHVERWRNCTRCPLHYGRSKVTFLRGDIPCDILFIGEAPGASEDSVGCPFIGPAGHFLDQILDKSIDEENRRRKVKKRTPLYYGLCNIVGCIPLGEDATKTTEPEPTEIRTCSKKLEELIQLAKPRLVVFVGALAKKWAPLALQSAGVRVPTLELVHPAAVLRFNVVQKGFAKRKCIVQLNNAIEKM